MAIQNRRGDYNDYSPTKMLPGEFGITLKHDPRTVDGKGVHITFAPGDDKTLMTFEDAETMIEIAAEEATAAAADSAEDAQEMSYTAEAWAVGTKNGIDVGSSDPQYHNNSKYYLEQAEAVAESIPEDYSELSDDVDQLKNAISEYNSYNIFDEYGTFTGGTSQNATLSWSADHVGTITRDGTGSANTVFGNILGSPNSIPSPLVVGETYIIEADITNSNVPLQIIEYVGESINAIYVTSYQKYTIPSNLTGLLFRIYCRSTFTGTATIKIKLLKAFSNKEITDNSVFAPNAKMFSIGNSILTGSVWKNGSFDHLAEYNNTPYGNIANALNISQSHVNHTMISSTGLMYDAGDGSFLENILDTDITGYDYILTHLYYQDLISTTSSSIGSLSSTADDGTVAGAVLSLLAYIRTSNPDCRLVLVGVPPTGVNSSDVGENVFTVGYSNGSNIIECDYLMHQLAEQEHFVFVDWEDLEISYNWKDFTDSLNIHLNNEDTYRAVGEYLGNQITAQQDQGNTNRVITKYCNIAWKSNCYINTNGKEGSSARFKVSDYIPVLPGETVCLQNVSCTTTSLIYVTCYDNTKSKIADARKDSGSPGTVVSDTTEYTVPNFGAYIRVSTVTDQKCCHVWHKNKEYQPHPQNEKIIDTLIDAKSYQETKITHGYIEGKLINPYGVAVSTTNWANTGYVTLGDTYDYIKLKYVSAGQSCYALFFDENQAIISTDIGDSNGVLSTERIIKPPTGAVYIRCNMLVANKDLFEIYGLKTNLVNKEAIPEKSFSAFHAYTGNKLHTIFRKTKAVGALFTITDDDTTSLANVQKFHTVCAVESIRGCYAVMTKNTEADSDIVGALLDYEKDGFQSVVHCNDQRTIFMPAPDRDIDACREDMAIAIQRMQSYGFSDYRHWVSPYGVCDQEMKELARDFGFDCLFGIAQPTYCRFIPHPNYGLFNIPRMELYPTDGESLPGNTLTEIKAQMLDCANNGGWFHLCTHMYQWGSDLSRVTEVLQYANTLGMKNVTISGGLSYWRDIYRLYELF